MAYDKTPWADNATALSAQNMNHIEQGIYDAHTDIATNSEDIETINQAITTEALKQQLIDVIYPVGSIYMSATLDTEAKVGAALGGTWVAWGAGRVPVGVSSGDSDFGTPDTPVGSKTKPYTPAGTTNNTTLTAAQSGNQAQTVTSGGMSANSTHQHGACSYTDNYFQIGSGKTISIHGVRNYSYSSAAGQYVTPSASTAHTHSVTIAAKNATQGHNHGFTGTATNINVIQPSITCYMYKRTA